MLSVILFSFVVVGLSSFMFVSVLLYVWSVFGYVYVVLCVFSLFFQIVDCYTRSSLAVEDFAFNMMLACVVTPQAELFVCVLQSACCSF